MARNNSGSGKSPTASSSNDDGSASMTPAAVKSVLEKLFSSCDGDPKGSVHRAWGISLLFVLLYFVLSIFEMIHVKRTANLSNAWMIASIWSGLMHLVLAVLGTFILKRFPTSFSVGFLMGLLVVLSNQNLILFATFKSLQKKSSIHVWFVRVAFALFLALSLFGLLLAHFRNSIIVAPIDAKGFGKRLTVASAESAMQEDDDEDEEEQQQQQRYRRQYEEES